MPTVSEIAAAALGAVQLAIPDAVHVATLTHSGGSASGRVVVDKIKPSSEFTDFTPSQSAQLIFMEGFTTPPTDGDTLTFKARDHVVIRVQDIVAAGSTFYVQAIPVDELFTAAISIERKSRTATGSGGFADVWAEVGAPDAYLAARSGREVFGADHMVSANGFRCIIPYRAVANGAPYYSAKDRVVYRARTYAIEGVVDMGGRGNWLELMLVEGGKS